MRKTKARELAKTVSLDSLKTMLIEARKNFTAWSSPSSVNIGFSKGYSFNLFVKVMQEADESLNVIAKTNMIREFGTFLPGYEPDKIEKCRRVEAVHTDPIEITSF